ncbi:DUF1540 domain-containing protein [Garciella nitratireducens]|uniref:DUF1540 domain-containing protein n=1 Tax=Garciella nitratireducens DSM 15102 TaxID=1121911 RepID=A0A1T4NW60_9FIRM|nr:DUF1540 domain-containing protein [Garciella nitratireducens]RBP46933.1 uncharacterized protein DUF1540 [Garciella nitratireducens]SJZ83479.1 protein of unknown function [Garciella nitratireducens DSM 15102]
MQPRISKSNQPIGRVKCVVDNCHFWASGNHCTAQEIEIQPPNSNNSEETDCITFIPHDMV